jgi:hypothetical protein
MHGIGGSTVAEAKENITAEEFNAWAAYIRKHGSLNITRRLDWGFALIASLIDNAAGGHRGMEDFMPKHSADDEFIDMGTALETWS